MAGLQRSEVSFRRQGSSGLVWDDRFISGELNKLNQSDQDHQEQGKETEHHHHHHQKPEITDVVNADAKPTVGSVQRSRSSSGYRTGKVSPAVEPPSPKLSACGFCGAFGKTEDKGHRRKKPAKRRPR